MPPKAVIIFANSFCCFDWVALPDLHSMAISLPLGARMPKMSADPRRPNAMKRSPEMERATPVGFFQSLMFGFAPKVRRMSETSFW